jgi:Ca2+-transporting ATPase
LKRVTQIEENGIIRPITDADKKAILATNKDLAKQALRVLMMAYKYVDAVPTMESDIVENDLVFSGLVGMIDPERPEAAEAVRVAKEAGIRPIMITGDHQDTAEAIAKRLGIIDPNDTEDCVFTGAELNELTDEEIKKASAIIVAADKQVEMARFEGKKVIIVPVAQGIRNPEGL